MTPFQYNDAVIGELRKLTRGELEAYALLATAAIRVMTRVPGVSGVVSMDLDGPDFEHPLMEVGSDASDKLSSRLLEICQQGAGRN